MMLGNYLSFNGTQFPNPLPQSTVRSQTIENVSQSEAGTDLVVMIRGSKKIWNMSFNLTASKKDFLFGLCSDERTTMVYMGQTYRVRVRDYSESLVEGSEWLNASPNGLYTCSVTVTEY